MKQKSSQDWIQILTAFAIIAGLMLVIMELYQARLLATLQLTHDGYAETFESKRQVIGDSPAPIITKACLKPNDLTYEEILVAVAVNDLRYDLISMMKDLAEIAGDEFSWKTRAEYQLQVILSNELGRIDFKEFGRDPNRWDPEIAEIAERIIQSDSSFRCQDLYNTFMDGVKKQP